MRTVIIGGPGTGKTTLAESYATQARIFHLDALIGTCTWSEQSLVASKYLDMPGPWVVEGVCAVRALRKWLERNDDGMPCDKVIYLVGRDTPQQHLRMTTQVRTIFEGMVQELANREVFIEIRTAIENESKP